jgi:hypothetical protein
MTGPAFRALTRHFVSAIVTPPILTDLGVDFLRRTIAGIFAILLVAGIFVIRALFKKYVDLGALFSPDAYLRALQADTLMMIAIPMLLIGVTAVVLTPMLFPDETDYRALSPLPITRLELFGAKLLALLIVVGTAIIAVNSVTSIWFPLAADSRWKGDPLIVRVAAHAVATVAGSAWMFAAVMALQGVSLVLLPGKWRRASGGALQATMLLLLLLSIPYVVRLPRANVSAETILTGSLVWFPPAWFLGIERWLLGDRSSGYEQASMVAVVAIAAALAVIVICYGALYRTAERLAGVEVKAARRSRPVRLANLPAATIAVVSFAVQGLTRSRLHQFVFLLVIGSGLAILIGQILTVTEGIAFLASRQRAAVHAAVSAPLLAALCVTIALRAAFLLPLDLEAAWVFQLTEDEQSRPRALDGVAHVFTIAPVGAALLLVAVLQPRVLGGSWILCAILTTLATFVLVEVVLRDWNRIPFTCTYLPGKRVLAYTLGVMLASYAVFVFIGANLIRWSLTHSGRTIFYGGLLLSAFAALRRHRLRTWGRRPLEFEDDDPLALRPLGLLPDERHL